MDSQITSQIHEPLAKINGVDETFDEVSRLHNLEGTIYEIEETFNKARDAIQAVASLIEGMDFRIHRIEFKNNGVEPMSM